MKRTRPCFTLVELLVVVAVITVLAAMLLPVLSLARAQALASNCTSNLKQCGLSVELYAEDWSDWVPGGWSNPVYWYTALENGNYLPINSWMRGCPAFMTSVEVSKGVPNGNNYAYGIFNRDYVYAANNAARTNLDFKRLVKADRFLYLADSLQVSSGTLLPVAQVAKMDRDASSSSLTGPHLRHPGGRLNAWLADGHVESEDRHTIAELNKADLSSTYKYWGYVWTGAFDLHGIQVPCP